MQGGKLKHLIALFVIGGLLCGPAVIWAGEKEEIELRLNLVAEKEKRLQAEWGLLQKEKAEVQKQAQEFAAKEKAKVPEKK